MGCGRASESVIVFCNFTINSLTSFSEDNFEEYWRVASKVTPTISLVRSQSPPPPPSTSMHSRPPSADQGGTPDKDGAYNVRSVPVRLYLPDGPVIQDLVSPLLEDGRAFTFVAG